MRNHDRDVHLLALVQSFQGPLKSFEVYPTTPPESGTCDAMLFKTFPIPLHHRNILPHLPIDVITFRYMISQFAPSDLLGPRVPHNSTGML